MSEDLYLNATHETITVESYQFGPIETHYAKLGEGPPVVLLHGLFTNGVTFHPLLETLSKHFTLYIPDLPGMGSSDKPNDALYEPEGLARWLGEFITTLSINPCPVVGHELGAMIAMRLALRGKRRKPISKVVALHPIAAALPRIYLLHAFLSSPTLSSIAQALIEHNPRAFLRRFLQSTHPDSLLLTYSIPLRRAGGPQFALKLLRETLEPGTLSAFHSVLRLRKYTDDDFPMPLFLAFGERDGLIPATIGQKLSQHLPEAELHFFPHSTRFLHVDEPDLLLPNLVEFLQRPIPKKKRKKRA